MPKIDEIVSLENLRAFAGLDTKPIIEDLAITIGEVYKPYKVYVKILPDQPYCEVYLRDGTLIGEIWMEPTGEKLTNFRLSRMDGPAIFLNIEGQQIAYNIINNDVPTDDACKVVTFPNGETRSEWLMKIRREDENRIIYFMGRHRLDGPAVVFSDQQNDDFYIFNQKLPDEEKDLLKSTRSLSLEYVLNQPIRDIPFFAKVFPYWRFLENVHRPQQTTLSIRSHRHGDLWFNIRAIDIDLDSKGYRRMLFECTVNTRIDIMSYSNTWKVLWVFNSTPEPDGSIKWYVLGMPNEVRTCLEAAAWTYSMPVELYKVLFES